MKTITNDLIEQYRSYLTDEEKSEATIEKYIRDIRVFAAWIIGRNAEKRLVLEYKEQLIDTYAPRSVNSVISSLNSFFDYAGWSECKVKTLKIQKQIFAERDRELSKAEYERLLKAAKKKGNERLYLLMQTICATGIRVSELRFITVEAVNARVANIRCKGKMRTVILQKKLCRMLRVYAKKRNIKSGSVFIARTGNPLSRTNIWTDMKKLCESAGVERSKVFPHNLRHLFAKTYYARSQQRQHEPYLHNGGRRCASPPA